MSQGPKAGRNESAVRDHLANERTYLSWIRTTLTLIGLGFAIERLAAGDALAQWVGLIMVVAGGFLVPIAALEQRQRRRQIDGGSYRGTFASSLVLAGGLVIGSLVLAFLMLGS